VKSGNGIDEMFREGQEGQVWKGFIVGGLNEVDS